jgi:hypothetical protein
VFGSIALFLQFGQGKLPFRPLWRLPACEGVRQIDADALAPAIGERSAEILEEDAELQVRHDKRRG